MRWALALGLFFGLAAVLFVVWSLGMRVTEDALAHHGREVESRIGAMVERIAREEFAAGGGGLAAFERRLRDASADAPEVRDLLVVAPGAAIDHPCLRGRDVAGASAHEHEAGSLAADPVGCLLLPVQAAGALQATVLLHVTREWAAGGELVQAAVRRTAWQLAPVFLGFYALLGLMLLAATRAAERWRRRAVQAERIEALGALASGVSHELRNPLNALGLCLQVLERRHTDPDAKETLKTARDQSRLIEGRLNDFVRLSGVARLDFRETALGVRIQEWVGSRVRVSGDATARVDADRIREAVDSIVDILVSYAPVGEAVRLRLGAGARGWWMRADAAAPDLDPGAVAHLLDPYLHSGPRDVARGLAWARVVFQAHGGELTATHRNGRLEVSGTAESKPESDG